MPRKHLLKTLGALALCSGLVVPAAASAESPGVGEQIRSADSALAKAETLVDRNQDALAAVQMARANAQTRGAASLRQGSPGPHRLAASGRSPSSSTRTPRPSPS